MPSGGLPRYANRTNSPIGIGLSIHVCAEKHVRHASNPAHGPSQPFGRTFPSYTGTPPGLPAIGCPQHRHNPSPIPSPIFTPPFRQSQTLALPDQHRRSARGTARPAPALTPPRHTPDRPDLHASQCAARQGTAPRSALLRQQSFLLLSRHRLHHKLPRQHLLRQHPHPHHLPPLRTPRRQRPLLPRCGPPESLPTHARTP